jgi:hypothetical protein
MHKFMANYLNDSDLSYEIIISKGKGILTRKASKFLVLIGDGMIRKMSYIYHYKDKDEENDCLQYSLLIMLEKWYNFDEKKYKKALPYFSEIAKRAITYQFNELRGKKSHQKDYMNFVSLDSSNDGNGLHNL